MVAKSLGYLAVASPDAKKWLEFGPEVLGMEAVEADTGSVLLRMDDADHRIAVQQGDRNRMLYMGWDVGSEDALEVVKELLDKRGIPFEVGTDEDRGARGVLGFLALKDPSGLRHELFYGQKVVPGSFRPGRSLSRFITGEQGLGHVVLATPDLAQADRFLRGVLGFKKKRRDLHIHRPVVLSLQPSAPQHRGDPDARCTGTASRDGRGGRSR